MYSFMLMIAWLFCISQGDFLREEIGKNFKLKEESFGPPSQYLSGKLRQVTMANSHKCSTFGSTQYLRAAVDNGEEYLGKKGKKFPAKALTPLSSKYRPKVDISEELGKDEGSYYHFMIGVPRWIVELV